MSYRIVALALGLVCAAGTGVVAYRTWASPGKKANRTNAGAEVAAPRAAGESARLADVALLGEVARLRSEVTALQDKAAREPAKEAAPAADQLSVEEGRAQADAKWAAHMEDVRVAYEQEHVDVAWAAEKRRAVKEAVEKIPGLSAFAGDIECRSESCRLDLKVDPAGSTGKDLPMFLHTVGPAMPTAELKYTDTEQGARYTVYLREHLNPSPDGVPPK